ncbi:hypothetical protein TTHERM_00812660 (macronuclear) [Tetrahymena thermophila SB210]|uniref:Uncharacterized protein n=1 Tax=Tetrahymena thermophila (strain SB210) TaxID=312017 RepID=Q22SW5_TETTS|nr:hypothetical protein TTHERM_00812660 [Tetrahymena thermophila SB210]EAR88349.1 hypothetical protein TTHERM_00812660 [Tetrahymena thermophila SB210]|eukprot:XP_001008594.1 hypothetical protein TTHERM_00812660 [Tetrahymena thermophila SB210]
MNIFNKLITQIQEFEKSNLLLEENNPSSFTWYHNRLNHKAPKNFEIKVTELRPFTFNNSRNLWVWFKNLVVPTIRLSASFNNSNNSILNSSSNQKCTPPQLYAKALCLKKLENNQFEEVLLSGKNNEKFNKDMCLIQGIKYSETTFVSRSQYFRMVILVSAGQKVDEITDLQDLEDIIISPPIYVEARQKFWLARQSIYENYDPFPSEIIEKKYEFYSKQSNEKSILSDDVASLYNYFLNPYIRHKSVNPLFLSLKFPRALNMYFNKDYIPDEYFDQNRQLINKQFLIFYQKIVYQLLEQTENQSDDQTNNQVPFILLYLNDPSEHQNSLEFDNLSQKISQFLSPLSSSLLNYSAKQPSQIPSNYIKLINIDDMKAAYKISQGTLEKIKVSRSSQSVKNESDNECSQKQEKDNQKQQKQNLKNQKPQQQQQLEQNEVNSSSNQKCCTCQGIIINKKRNLGELSQQNNFQDDSSPKETSTAYSTVVIDLTCRDILQKRVKITIPIYKNDNSSSLKKVQSKKQSDQEYLNYNKICKDLQNKDQSTSLSLSSQKCLDENDIVNQNLIIQEEQTQSQSNQNKGSYLYSNNSISFNREKMSSESQTPVLKDTKKSSLSFSSQNTCILDNQFNSYSKIQQSAPLNTQTINPEQQNQYQILFQQNQQTSQNQQQQQYQQQQSSSSQQQQQQIFMQINPLYYQLQNNQQQCQPVNYNPLQIFQYQQMQQVQLNKQVLSLQ